MSLLATDLSLHGLWLESSLPLHAGSELSISLVPPQWPGRRPLQVRGRVARVGLLRRRCDSGSPGMGISFVGLRAEQIASLTQALQGLPPRLPPRAATETQRPPVSSAMTAILSVSRPRRD